MKDFFNFKWSKKSLERERLKQQREQEHLLSIARKVNYIFETYRKDDGSKFSYDEVADNAGNTITGRDIAEFAQGKQSGSALRLVEALNKFFVGKNKNAFSAGFWLYDLDEWLQRVQADSSIDGGDNWDEELGMKKTYINAHFGEMTPGLRKHLLEIIRNHNQKDGDEK